MFQWSLPTAIRFWRMFPVNQDEFYPDTAGDRVTVELSPYDLSRGRIVYRFK